MINGQRHDQCVKPPFNLLPSVGQIARDIGPFAIAALQGAILIIAIAGGSHQHQFARHPIGGNLFAFGWGQRAAIDQIRLFQNLIGLINAALFVQPRFGGEDIMHHAQGSQISLNQR